MKIVYLSTARVPDEWAHVTQILKMCEAFAKAGNDVELVVPNRTGVKDVDPFAQARVAPIFKITKLPCVDLFPGTQSGFLYWLRTGTFLASARRYLAKTSYDLLYTREPFAPGDLSKTVFELHAMNSVRHALNALRGSCGVVAITNGLKEDLVASGLTRERIHVAPDAVDLDDFANPESKAAARTRLGVPQDKKAAFYIGILDPWKGTDTLYAAAKLLSPDIQTVVIGGFDGEEQALIPLHPEVQFLGYRPYTELPGNQQAADVLVLPNSGKEVLSAKYTSPLKLFTYMASGVPIVASDLPSLREILSEQNAYLVPADTPEALAQGIEEALAHPEEAKVRAVQARADVQEYTWEKRAQKILSSLISV